MTGVVANIITIVIGLSTAVFLIQSFLAIVRKKMPSRKALFFIFFVFMIVACVAFWQKYIIGQINERLSALESQNKELAQEAETYTQIANQNTMQLIEIISKLSENKQYDTAWTLVKMGLEQNPNDEKIKNARSAD
jgi:hypothetical protein